MLYHLLSPLAEQHPFFNLFRYITFRATWGLVTALAICYLMFPSFIQWMKNKRMEQIIRDDGPQSHIEQKVGTPTMGGVPMIASITLSTLLWARLDQPLVWMALIVFCGYGLIGFVDDWKKVMQRNAAGLAGRYQMLGQFGGDVKLALAAYNAGPAAVRRHGGVPPYAETQAYVAAILDRMALTAPAFTVPALGASN